VFGHKKTRRVGARRVRYSVVFPAIGQLNQRNNGVLGDTLGTASVKGSVCTLGTSGNTAETARFPLSDIHAIRDMQERTENRVLLPRRISDKDEPLIGHDKVLAGHHVRLSGVVAVVVVGVAIVARHVCFPCSRSAQ